MPGLKQGAKTLIELADSAVFYVRPRPLQLDDKARELLTERPASCWPALRRPRWPDRAWTATALEAACREGAEQQGLKLGKIAQPLRAALTGATVSPGDLRGPGGAGPRRRRWRGSTTRRRTQCCTAARR